MAKYIKIVLCSVATLFFTGCAQSALNYTPPSNFNPDDIQTTKTISKDYNKAWDELVNKLSDNSFVINNMNKESGFINLDFSVSNPVSYVDCGRWIGYTKNLTGEANYNFSGAESTRFSFISQSLTNVQRQTTLSGKINILLQEVSPKKLMYKVNVRYVLSSIDTRYITYPAQIVPINWAVKFGSKERGRNDSGGQTECQTTGKLEADLLNFISE